MSNTKQSIDSIIELWKELGVQDVEFQFSCGGDSMNDTSITINGKNGEEIENDELSCYFDNEVYNNVDFYEASDGHYQGESGTVYITLEDNEDDFCYSKSSQSEWSESVDSELEVELSRDELDLLNQKVLNINGSEGDYTVNYKSDCILSDKEERLTEDIREKILVACRDHEPESDMEGELEEWYTFTTNEEGVSMSVNENKLLVYISNRMIVWRDGD